MSTELPVPADPLGRGLSRREIADGEPRLGSTIPDRYEQLLACANGYRLTDVVSSPALLEIRVLSGIVRPEEMVGYNAYFSVEKSFRPAGSSAFGHSPRGAFVVFERTGRVGFVERASKKVRTVAPTMDAFLAGLRSRAHAVVHASSVSCQDRAPRAPAPSAPPFAITAAVRCTFDGRGTDARACTTFERIELVRPLVKTRHMMNLVCRNVLIDGCESGPKALSLVNVTSQRQSPHEHPARSPRRGLPRDIHARAS